MDIRFLRSIAVGAAEIGSVAVFVGALLIWAEALARL